MGRLSASVQLIIGIVLIVVLAAVVVMLAIVPQFTQAAEVDTRIQAAETDLVTAQALLARRQSAKAQSAANEVELMRIANRMPDSPQLPSLIIELQDIANASGLDLPRIVVGDVVEAEAAEDGTPAGYSTLEVTVGLTGSWADLVEFNHRLHKLDRGVRVIMTMFTYVPETDDEPAYVDASVSMRVYMMSPAPVAPAEVEAPAADDGAAQ